MLNKTRMDQSDALIVKNCNVSHHLPPYIPFPLCDDIQDRSARIEDMLGLE